MRKILYSMMVLFMSISSVVSAQQNEAAEITPWDGSEMELTMRRGDTLTFEYTATAKGILYVYSDDQASTDYLPIDIYGGIYLDGAYDEVLKLEDTGCYDENYRSGVFGKIIVWEGDKVRFTLAAPTDAYGKKTDFTLKRLFFSDTTSGSSWESPITLTQNSRVKIPTFTNTSEFVSDSHVTFCNFVAPSSGVASIYTEEYIIYYIEESMIGAEYPKQVVMDESTNDHEFAVQSGEKYIVMIPNRRPANVTFKMTQSRLGLSEKFPIVINEFPTSLDLVKGDNYYKFDHELIGNNTMMEVDVEAGWNGTITYMDGTDWGASESDELGKNTVTGSAMTFYKNIDPRFLGGNATVINFNVKNQASTKATLKVREPEAGESFDKAATAHLGENTFDGPARNYWFAYTADTDCELSFASSTDSIKHVNFTAGVELMVPTNTYRVDEGETIYICVQSETAGTNTLTITSREIVAGDYCDKPVMFTLGEDITIKGDTINIRDKYHSFVAEENGFAVFTSPGWSIYFREECGGRQLNVERTVTETEDGNIQFTYRLPILKDNAYIVELQAVSEVVTISTAFEAAADGDVCATAVEIENLNDTIKIDYAFDVAKWYKLTAEKSGFYTVCAKLGNAANMTTKVGDCDATETNAQSDNNHENAYMGGYRVAKVYVEEGHTLYIYTKTGSENVRNGEDQYAKEFGTELYLVATFAEARPGEHTAVAIEAVAGTEYTVLNNNSDGYEQWYSYTIPADKEMTITLKATMKFITNSLSFYKEDKSTSMSSYKGDFTQTNLTNEAGETIGKSYAFAAAETDRLIYIKVSMINAMYNPVVWKIENDDNTGDDNTGDESSVTVGGIDTQTSVIYDLMGRRVVSPSEGIYIINGKKVVIR